MAGLIALINELKQQPVGFIHPQLYANPNICRDITEGNNITTSTNLGYAASQGWDACTGLGVLSHL
jgi:kumamolisin